MSIISIHQPVYLPWLGFFEKIISSEKFVFLDDVQYEKNGFQNRNKIRTTDGDMWLTIPVKTKSKTLLKNVKIDDSSNWMKKHSKSILLNYSQSKFFDNYWPELKKIYEKKYEYLVEINMEIIKLARENGVMISVNTDAHHQSGLDHIRHGIGIARKGWLQRNDVLNTLDVDSFLKFANISK